MFNRFSSINNIKSNPERDQLDLHDFLKIFIVIKIEKI